MARGRPSSSATCGAMGKLASAATSGGKHAASLRVASVAAINASDQRRVRTSSQPVPDASPYSIQRSPVSQKLT
jgi:hypothetical protein